MGIIINPATLSWLRGVLSNFAQEYRNVERAYSDICQAVSQSANLSLRTDVYTYENGQPALLVNLAGTIPVSFRGTAYLFPVSIWVPHGYPRAPPMVFVTPTKDMAIRAGQYVSAEGRVYHPYLANWKEEHSTIVEFLSILKAVFTLEPPVVSRQYQNPQQREILRYSASPGEDGQPPPIPPLPPELGGRQSRTSNGVGERPPRLPPKPFAVSPQPYNVPFGPSELKPPIPPHPNISERGPSSSMYAFPSNRMGSTHPDHSGGVLNTPPKNANFRPGHNVLPLQLSNLQHQQHSDHPVSPLTPESHVERHTSLPLNPSAPQHGPLSPGVPADPMSPSMAYNQWTGVQPLSPLRTTFAERLNSHNQFPASQPPRGSRSKPAEDLLTSPFDTPLPSTNPDVPPPPIPPSPEKDAILSAISQNLTQRVQSTYAANHAAVDHLRAQQSALQSTLNNINREISQLNELDSLLCSNEAILHQAMRDADKVIEEAKHRKVPEVDEVLVAPTIVAGQLYALVAEQSSIEDCRAVLGKALDKGRIGGDVWAKQTRSLAREEFLKKALIKKIARGMGLMEAEKWS